MISEELMRRNLYEYLREAWPHAVPNRPFIDGWHIGAVCEHLQAVMEGQVRRLLIEVPPGTTKTKTVGTFLPSWKWLKHPGYQWLFVGNSDELAMSESMVCRRLVESQWYRQTFGIPWTLQEDQDQKGWFENTAGGHRICKGIRANVTGRKGDAVVVDDANDAERVQSEAERRIVNGRYDNAIDDRVISFEHGPRIIIGQRTHEQDLIGHCKAHGGWEVLTIPEEFDLKRRYVTAIGWTDPRRHNGEMLRPHDFSPQSARNERRKNLLMYMAKRQQTPRSAEGIRFKAAWFKHRWRYDPDGEHIIITDHRGDYRFHPFKQARMRFGTADGAASAKSSADWTVICCWIITERNDLLLFSAKRIQAEIPEQPDIMQREYDRWKMEWVGIEGELSNVALVQFSKRRPMVVRQLGTKGRDKLARATPAIILAESGRIYLPDEDAAFRNDIPLPEIEAEITGFTGDEKLDMNDDVIDNISYAVEYFNQWDAGGDNTAPSIAAKPGATAWIGAGGPPQGKPWVPPHQGNPNVIDKAKKMNPFM